MKEVREKRQPDWFWMNKSIVDNYGPEIGAIGIAVYAILARCANEEGHAFPSVRYISRHLGLATNTVMKYLEKLKACELITMKLRRDKAGDKDTTEYVLLKPNMDSTQEGVSPIETPISIEPSSTANNRITRKRVSQAVRHGVSSNGTPEYEEVSQSVRHGVSISETPGGVGVSQLVKGGVSTGETFKDQENNTTKEKPKDLNPPSPYSPPPLPKEEVRACVKDTEAIAHYEAAFTTYTPGFETLRTVYPSGRLEGIQEAWQVWHARDLEPRSEEIVAKVVRLVGTIWRGRELRYIPLLKTWLDKGRYNDPLVSIEEAQPKPISRNPQGMTDKEYRSVQNGMELAKEIMDEDERINRLSRIPECAGGDV